MTLRWAGGNMDMAASLVTLVTRAASFGATTHNALPAPEICVPFIKGVTGFHLTLWGQSSHLIAGPQQTVRRPESILKPTSLCPEGVPTAASHVFLTQLRLSPLGIYLTRHDALNNLNLKTGAMGTTMYRNTHQFHE